MRKIITPNIWFIATLTTLALSLLIVLGLIVLSIVRIDVLEDSTWTLVPDKTEYSVGDTITITNTVTKLRDVQGARSAYIVCPTNTGSENRYGVGEAQGNSGSGTNKRDVSLKIPDLPNPPRQCAIEFSIDYGYPYRLEVKRTQDFTVNPRKVTDQTESIVTPENDNVVVENSPSNKIQTREIPTPIKQEDIPLAPPVQENTPRTNPPNLLDKVTGNVLDLINNTLD